MYQKYFNLLATPKLLHNLNRIKSKVYKKVGTLDTKYTVDAEPIPFEERLTRELKPLKKRQRWGNVFDCAWMNFTGIVPQNAKGKKVVLLINVDGEGCLFDNSGNPVKGLSVIGGAIDYFQPAKAKTMLEFCDNAVGGETIDIWVETGHNKLSINFKNYAILKQADIAVMREDINSLYYDYLTLLLKLTVLKRDSQKYSMIKKSLSGVMKLTGDFSPECVAKAREELLKATGIDAESEYTYYGCGHAHLDLAWLWPIRETKRKLSRTFSNQIYNIEKYPDYIFGVSQPQQLEWMKEIYPSLYDKVKSAIAQERIEPQGRMWVECDTNVPCGESLIRQSIYGEKFWQQEFGKTSKVCWLPDVFGFSGNLPQILKKCGMDYFLTIKLSWNEQNLFPYRTFKWEGIDDSKVLVHMPPEGNYNSDASPISLFAGLKRNSEKNTVKQMALLYGIGDGGGGPSEGHIECALRQQGSSENPSIKFSPIGNLFNDLAKIEDQIPSYKGELYLEKHQGTLTSQAKNKYYNRLMEKNLHNLEFLATYAAIKKGADYPYEALEKLWKEVLLYQFHDIIPGSSIKRVYDESVARYEHMNEEVLAIQNEILNKIGNKKNQLCATNTTSYIREEFVKHGEKLYKATVKPYSSAKLEEAEITKMENMENDILELTFGENGEIKKLYHKQLNKDFCGSFLNKLSVYWDRKLHYNAWDIDIKYTKQTPDVFTLVSYQQYQDGNSIIRENLYKYNRSTLTQKIILTMGKPYVEFDNSIEWQETHKMLRAEFAPSVYSDEVTCDIQFGNLKRTTKDKTSIEKAQFEVAAHKWVDLSNDGYGISLLNDSKYGHRVKRGIISLNLLRSPMWPAKDADKGIHSFRYALYPHSDNCNEAGVARAGYVFNNPLIVSNACFDSFVCSSDNHIVIETVKMAENKEKELIIRAYEDGGITREGSITIDTEYKKAILTDMLENEIEEISLDKLTFKPFEVKTIKIIL